MRRDRSIRILVGGLGSGGFTGGRLRTLDEMNDPKVYRAHMSEIVGRR